MLGCKTYPLKLIFTLLLVTIEEKTFAKETGYEKGNIYSSKTSSSGTSVTGAENTGKEITRNVSNNSMSIESSTTHMMKVFPDTSDKGMADQEGIHKYYFIHHHIANYNNYG